MSLRVVGIDPSLTSTGLALIEEERGILALEHVGSKSQGEGVKERLARIDELADRVTFTVMQMGGADVFVIEGPSHNSKFGKPHERAGLWWSLVKMIGHYYPGSRFYEVAPTSRAKYGTGKGNSNKAAVYAAVKETYTPQLGDLKLSCDDEGDALLLASMGARVLGCPVEATEPSEDRLAALSGLVRQVEG